MNSASRTPRQPGFFRVHILPVLFVFLIPLLSLWVFSYAERSTNEKVLAQLTEEIKEDRKIDAENKARAIAFFSARPISEVMASNRPEDASIQAMFEPVSTRYATFRWMKRIAWICLGTIFASFILVGLSVAFSLRSQSAQYYALRIGWPVLRTASAVLVLGQAALAVGLSFWGTVVMSDRYYPKLIVMISILAGIGVIALWKAIFTKVVNHCEVRGENLSESDAPALWQRIRDMAARLNTAPPDRIIVGIDANFFVTEHPVILNGQVQNGRTLYLSLPMMKVMTSDEADAVLGHELAHFSGEDTLWSRKISPLLGKFSIYLNSLATGLTWVVAHFMHLFWKLYGLSINRLSRAREFRADAVAASLVSNDAMKRALVKTAGYCEYRADTEIGIVTGSEIDPNLNLPRRLEEGYVPFLASFARSEKAAQEAIPHPFDTHPTLHSRLAELGFESKVAMLDEAIQRPVENSWYKAISTAPALEERMWAEHQKALQNYQTESLAWGLMPTTEGERTVVENVFPRTVLSNLEHESATLEFDRLRLHEWTEPLLFKHISSAIVEDTLKGKRLTLTHCGPGQDKPKETKLYPQKYVCERGNLLDLFGLYWARHQHAMTDPKNHV